MPSYIKKCSICNNDFETKRSHTLYCSIKCSKKEEYNRNKDRYEINCQCCGKLFKTSKQQTRLCSHACINIATKKHNDVIKECKECKEEFVTSYIKRDKEFCKRSCAIVHMNKNRTEETNIKISETVKNQFASGERVHPFTGKRLTEQHKQRISEERIIKGSAAGKNNPMYGKKGKNNPNYGKIRTSAMKEKYSQEKSEQWINGKYNNVNFNNLYKRGNYFSTKMSKEVYYRSSWEKHVFEYLDKNEEVVNFLSEPFSLPYYYDNNKRHYIPAILVSYKNGSQTLIEIKPEYQVTAIKNQAKFKAAQEYCDSKGILFEVWTEKTINNLFIEESTNDLQI